MSEPSVKMNTHLHKLLEEGQARSLREVDLRLGKLKQKAQSCIRPVNRADGDQRGAQWTMKMLKSRKSNENKEPWCSVHTNLVLSNLSPVLFIFAPTLKPHFVVCMLISTCYSIKIAKIKIEEDLQNRRHAYKLQPIVKIESSWSLNLLRHKWNNILFIIMYHNIL